MSLVAPLVHYPDDIVDVIFQASRLPEQIALAARYLSEPTSVKSEPSFSEDILALMQYPTLLIELSENLVWLSSLHKALGQSEERVWAALERLRQEPRPELGTITVAKSANRVVYRAGPNSYVKSAPAYRLARKPPRFTTRNRIAVPIGITAATSTITTIGRARERFRIGTCIATLATAGVKVWIGAPSVTSDPGDTTNWVGLKQTTFFIAISVNCIVRLPGITGKIVEQSGARLATGIRSGVKTDADTTTVAILTSAHRAETSPDPTCSMTVPCVEHIN